MFCLRSPRRSHRRVETFEDPPAEIDKTNNYSPPPSNEIQSNYQNFLETKKIQQSMLSNQLRQEIESKRRLLDMQTSSISIQEQTDFLLNQFKSFKRPEPRTLIENRNENYQSVYNPQLFSLRDYIQKSPRRYNQNNVRKPQIAVNEEFVRPMRTNFSKFVLPSIKPEPYCKKLDSSSELVYPDGHYSAVSSVQDSRPTN
ncbi:hypothetical protein TVAG_431980 [Trichomonas vaginalis G3]|uniref:Uncharacterized protein n=1 Tax=Trichomonas vaginalis (strain ATCC PRA-98 / G3) TaxID=412133 RepID=A2F7Z5_TRIV3|nr:hypothetical protein TVAGG3_0671720 [Trichomonas vaginalis G3]EAX98989.1 hypothetical protein TVAG_431980 [Trichomonas vaginalis G3]KAI5507247.1 hypothetical protein TVAGG3_0671720 [Trichomonas vaginalis G3]|eukprot:XP_001311919.1 hypothetical protein [Trichomonas vaginalis G3]